MKRVLVVPYLNNYSGGAAVGAWTLQAMQGRYEVAVLTWRPVEVEIINRAFGTTLSASQFEWHSISATLRRWIERAPSRLGLLRTHLIYRHARQLHRRHRFDVVMGLTDEIDVGERAIQYIHFPWAVYPRQGGDANRWRNAWPLILLYRALCAPIARCSPRRIAANLTLVNSDWTGRVFQKWYGGPTKTLHPPVSAGFPNVPLADRERGFVCVGRFSPEKELEKVVEIIGKVRERGHDVSLRLVGRPQKPEYLRRIADLAERQGSWVSLLTDVSRTEMVQILARSRYGLHGMVGEHFGIAPAEMQRAGCLTFVPSGGGTVEIVDEDERLIYHSVDDAVAKIDRALSDPTYEAEIRKDLEARRDRFSTERFLREILEVVDAF